MTTGMYVLLIVGACLFLAGVPVAAVSNDKWVDRVAMVLMSLGALAMVGVGVWKSMS